MGRDSKDATTLESDRERTSQTSAGVNLCHVVFCPEAQRIGTHFEIAANDDVIALGRDAGPSGSSFDDPRMSRLHARVTYDAAQRAFRFGDAKSSNGTHHNGRRADTGLLENGDVLRLGDTLLVFERGRPMLELNETIARVAPTDLTVLISGESGTGKELFAKSVHELSGRKGPFVAVNCAAIPRDLVASELFGHTRGAFSNATHARTGLFLSAQDGSLLLDEIGDLPLDQQPALLRVLQERSVRPVGSDRELKTTARVLVATHVDLAERLQSGAFRGDLLARIAQCTLQVPALRERRSEVLALARTFAERAGRELELSPDAAERLLIWNWPFNVRELEALVQTFCVLAAGARLDLEYLSRKHPMLLAPDAAARAAEDASGKPSQRDDLQRLIQEHAGNISAVARALGKPRAQIYRWLRRYHLALPGPRGKIQSSDEE
ncbi:MAG TPA: sigma 54-interacting transcriptional regulator [Polyangiaceae bacterium]|nr:sigma 54-interacting transcriptional regulator [Polyangiaceae bacterium]